MHLHIERDRRSTGRASSRRSSRPFLLSVLVALLAAAPFAASAQTPGAKADTAEDSASLQREFDALFQETLKRPSDLDVTLRYAVLANKIGDYEAAITALQRILLYNPALAQARVELGVLYFRLASYGAAQNYLEEARNGNLTTEQRERVEEYLGRLQKLQSRHRLTGEATAGFQHQSNANLGPASTAVRAAGLPSTLGAELVRKSDENIFVTGSLLYSYDLQNQDQDTIEATANVYGSRHFRVKQFDFAYAEGTVGPRFTLKSLGMEGFSVRPFFLLNYAQLGDDPFFHSYGFGVEATKSITRELMLRTSLEHRERNFVDSPPRATSRLLTGQTDGVTLGAQYALPHDQAVSLTGSLTRISGRASSETNLQYGLTAVYQIAYPGPIKFPTTTARWQTSLGVSRVFNNSDAPDPSVDPVAKRLDRTWRFSITEIVPVTTNIAVYLQLQRDIISSSLPNFAFTNTSVTAGPRFRF